MKKIAVIGSSGGNLRSQGGADPQKMMAEIFAQAKAAGIEVSAIQFILTEGIYQSNVVDSLIDQRVQHSPDNSFLRFKNQSLFRYAQYLNTVFF